MFGFDTTLFEMAVVLTLVMAAGFMFSFLTDIISWFAQSVAKWE